MFGSHLSIAGGMTNALHAAATLGLDTVQVFTKNQRQWRVAPLAENAQSAWLEELDARAWRSRTVAHDSYLINLASPKDDLWEKSIAMMLKEIRRCDDLSIPFLVSHPGAHTGSGLEAGLDRIAAAYKRIFAETKDAGVVLCLENTAGGGSTIGRTFDELADLRARILDASDEDADLNTKQAAQLGVETAGGRIGFCIDTCHALAGGYDVTTEKKADAVIEELDDVCGLELVRVLHLNDSKGALGSRIDRHEHIGRGEVGDGCFAAVVNHERFAQKPKILETPKGEDENGTPWDTNNLERLRKLVH